MEWNVIVVVVFNSYWIGYILSVGQYNSVFDQLYMPA